MIDLSQAKDAALYVIDKIKPEIEKENFRRVYRYTQYLQELCRFAAIAQERNEPPSMIIRLPDE